MEKQSGTAKSRTKGQASKEEKLISRCIINENDTAAKRRNPHGKEKCV